LFVFLSSCLGKLLPTLLATVALICCCLFAFWCDSIKFTPIDSLEAVLADLSDTLGQDFTAPDVALGPWFRKDTQIVTVSNSDGETRIFASDVCAPLPDGVDMDGKWQAVRALSIVVLVVGGLATLALVLSLCLDVLSAKGWKYLAVLFVLVLTTLQALTFLLFDSNACTTNPLADDLPTDVTDAVWTVILATIYKPECEWSHGSTANVISVVCWFLTGISMLAVGSP